MDYQLIDCGHELKLEKFGTFNLVRPASLALWKPRLDEWENVDASFSREGKKGWELYTKMPDEWLIEFYGLKFKLKRTDFGHLGLFPEHATLWPWIEEKIALKERPKILNLFAYSGSATLKMATLGAQVTHVDAAFGMVQWAKENASMNHLTEIRWIVEDARKFVAREIKRGVTYDAIVLDPPSFGRGKSGELFKIETDLLPLLEGCSELLSKEPLFLLLTSHTPGLTPKVLGEILKSTLSSKVEEGEMVLTGRGAHLPSGTYARAVFS